MSNNNHANFMRLLNFANVQLDPHSYRNTQVDPSSTFLLNLMIVNVIIESLLRNHIIQNGLCSTDGGVLITQKKIYNGCYILLTLRQNKIFVERQSARTFLM